MEFQIISKEQLKRKIDRGERMQLVDIRPYSVYWNAHIRGALSLPYDKIPDRAWEMLNPTDPIIVYGDDEKDMLVKRAADTLVSRKFDPAHISIFSEGLIGWRGAGYFTSSGDEL